ncbi:MAG: imidazolonepropionase [Steroidobacteraceae bacterium]
MRCDRLWRRARVATLAPGRPGLGLIERGVVAAADGRIVFVGPESDWPRDCRADEEIDLEGRLVTPGLIDCHTHLVYAGDRAEEHEKRLAGASYETIARAGGGILSTVRATRAATEAELVSASLPRLDALIAEGVTTVEIKSGYGLTLEHERKQLRAARELARLRSFTLKSTFLGAHAVPPELEGRADEYVHSVCAEMIPAIAAEGLADAVDVFCEHIGFSPAQARAVLDAAAACGLAAKVHAEQLSNQHGAALAASVAALSADHLEYLDEAGAAALAHAGTTAVLLPGAFYFMRETRVPPIDLLRRHGVRVALATDCNPGTSPLTSLLAAMNLAAVLFGMSAEECWIGVTQAAAHALGLGSRAGTLEPGKQCDLAIWNAERPAELVHRLGPNPLHARIWRGR